MACPYGFFFRPSEVRRRTRLPAEIGYSVDRPKCAGNSRQEQIGLNAFSKPGNFAECV